MVGFFDPRRIRWFYDFQWRLGVGSVIACVWLTIKPSGLLSEWKAVRSSWGWCGFPARASLYFTRRLAGMTNPPMEWGYPRTVEGFWHAMSRGQYDKVNPTDIFHNLHGHFLTNWACWCMVWPTRLAGSICFSRCCRFFLSSKCRNASAPGLMRWPAIYPFLGVLLSIFLSPTRDRQTADLVKVFFIASHSIVAILIGYGLALTAAYMATHYQKFRFWGFVGRIWHRVLLALVQLVTPPAEHYFGLDRRNIAGDLPHWIGQALPKINTACRSSPI
jgi:hypothetical protein